MSQKIAVDVGHGYVKALSETGERVLFSSLIAPAPAAVDLGEFGNRESVFIDEKPYVVGDAARPYATPLWSRDKATDSDTLRMVLIAAAQLGGVGPVALATGLPLSWFGNQRKAFRDVLMGYGAVIQLPDHPPQRLWFERVRVLPQGVAAAVVVLTNPSYRPGPYVVIDIGYRTTEYLMVSKSAGAKLSYDATQAGSLEIGTHAIAATMSSALEREYHLSFKPAEIESETTVFAYGQAIDLNPIRQQAVETVSNQLRDQLTEILDDRLLKAAGIVLVGGGSGLLAGAFPGAVVVADAQWANAQAYLHA